MRVIREVTQTTKVVDKLRCDLCSAESANGVGWGSKDHSQTTHIHFADIEMFANTYRGKHIFYDICPKCFTEKLMPWLTRQGAEPTVEEVDG